MRRFLILAAALGAFFRGAAARPANGYFYFTMPKGFDVSETYGKVEWNWDGRSHFWLGTPRLFPGLKVTYGLAYTWDDDLLITNKTNDELYKVKPGEAIFDTQKNSWRAPEHIFVEPGLKSAWITSRGGNLYRIPLDPYGKAVETPPTGSEKGINTIAYRDADAAWYTQSKEGDSSQIGEFDPKTRATKRRLTIRPLVNDSHYDPFTRNVILCGDKDLLQYDPVLNAIVSERVFPDEKELYSCVVDGEGHVILSSGNGNIFFVDYSRTGKIGDTTDFFGATKIVAENKPGPLGVLYNLTPLIGPGSPPRIYRPFYFGTRGTYRDADGDGRIDGAVLEFKAEVYDPPSQVRLTDLSVPVGNLVLDSSHIVNLDPTHFLLDLRDRPLPFGTSVKPGATARILKDESLFATEDLPMGDGVGPQVTAAQARPPQNKGDKPTLTVTFSEDVKINSSAKRFPFLIKRPDSDVNGQIQVESIRDLGSYRYEYVFASDEFPLLGDSLKLVPADTTLRDLAGNLNNMSIWIKVGGLPLAAFSIQPENKACVVAYGPVGPMPPVPAVLVVDAVAGRCLNCTDDRVAAALGDYTPSMAARNFHPWLMTLKIQGPMRYALNFFDNLGAFMNSAEGAVSADMIRNMRQGKDHLYTVRFYWWPVTQSGLHPATGAYIMRGILSGDGLDNPLLRSSPEAQGLPQKTEKVSATFGFLRGN